MRAPSPTRHSPHPPSIELAPGAEDNGLAVMLADLVRQNLEAKPHKRSDFDALDGAVSIVADDADVALTLRFEQSSVSTRLTIHDGIVGIPDVTIRGSSDTILALSNMPLMTKLGLPIPDPRDKEAVKTVRSLVDAMRAGKFHVYGMALHMPLVMRLTRVMSING
jgi:hypothetical protein